VKLIEPKAGAEGASGFVDFGTLKAAAAAVARDGQSMSGRPLVVCYSKKAAPAGSDRRSQEARTRRRAKREEKREDGSSTGGALRLSGS